MSDCLNLMPACIPAEGDYTISFWARGMDDMPHMCCFLDTRRRGGDDSAEDRASRARRRRRDPAARHRLETGRGVDALGFRPEEHRR